MEKSKPLICIGLGTFKRVQMLEKALKSVGELQIPSDFEVQLIVCDNDEKKSALPVYRKFQQPIPLQSHYIVQPNRGIVHVRNTIMETANSLCAVYLAFFDDDETVAEDWLVRLVSCAREYQADAVAGKAIYLNDKGEEISFLNKKKRVTGEWMTSSSTNNVMFSLSFCKTHLLKFHLAFNDSGGSDTFFFEQFHRLGGKIVHCAEALSYEHVVEERNSEKWLNNRVFRDAYNLHIRNKLLKGYLLGLLVSILKVIFIGVRYPFLNMKRRKKAMMKMKGMTLSISGKPYQAYEKIYGH